MKINKILVPIDFSPCSKNALHYAANMANMMNAKIVLIHVLSIPTPFTDISYYMDLSVVEKMEDEIQNSMESLIRKTPELENTEKEVVENLSVVDGIVEKAKKHNVDLIIMGTHGTRGFNEIFFSSHAASVLKETRIPVLIVPEMFSSVNIKKIAFAGDYKELKEPSEIKLLRQIAKKFKAEVVIFNVSPEQEPISVERAFEAAQLEDYLKQTKHDYREITHNDIEAGIKEFMEEHKIDLLVMIPRRHTLIERMFRKSLTRKMAHHLAIPLLVLHDE